MCVTSLPRRTERVKQPGFEDESRARNEPSKPCFCSNSSASMPDIVGWNHLRYIKANICTYNKATIRALRRVHIVTQDVGKCVGAILCACRSLSLSHSMCACVCVN